MRPLLFLLASVLAFAGCIGSEPTPSASPQGEERADPATAADAPQETTLPGAPEPLQPIAIAFDGHVGSGVIACLRAPSNTMCASQAAVPGSNDVILEDLAVRVVGGALTLTWEASSAATQELAMGIMQMFGGDACPAIQLGIVSGPSPLTLPVGAAERAICAEEVLHVWVSSAHFGEAGPVYHQVDVDQTFHLEGLIDVAHAG